MERKERGETLAHAENESGTTKPALQRVESAGEYDGGGLTAAGRPDRPSSTSVGGKQARPDSGSRYCKWSAHGRPRRNEFDVAG